MRAVAASTQQVAALAQASGGEKYHGSGSVSGALRTAVSLRHHPGVPFATTVPSTVGWPSGMVLTYSKLAVVGVEGVVVIRKIRYVEVHPAVVVVIAYSDAHRGLLAPVLVQRETRGQADVFERAVAAIAIEIVRRRVIGHEQVGPAVVVHVHPRSRKAVVAVGIRDPASLRDSSEGPVAVIAE